MKETGAFTGYIDLTPFIPSLNVYMCAGFHWH